MTGLKLKSRSYAHAVTADSEDRAGELEMSSVEQQVAAFLTTRDINLDVDTIEACHPLPDRDNNTPAVILRAGHSRVLSVCDRNPGTGALLLCADHPAKTKKAAFESRQTRFLQSPDGVLSCCDWFLVLLSYLMLLFTLPLSIWRCFKVIHTYERAVIYRLGRVWRGGNRGPGLVFVLPWTDTLMRVDVRTITFNIPPQEVVTEDLVRVWTDGVICYRVQNAAKCVTNVSDVHVAIRLLAQTAVRKVLSTMSLRDILSEQEEVTSIIQSTLEATMEDWGIQIQQVEIRMSNCPQQLHNFVADKVAAVEGHLNSPLMQKEAAVTGETAAAPRLRYLQTLQNSSFFGGLVARGEYRSAMSTHGTAYAPPPVPSNACHVRLPV
ncbi:erythrocyte band 7 integral membrane protein-like [Thalassophryne amazonica]|uniref:erythrocyte band 7 integral membrane protein-like n=1 Tax=Thalassophryne amazonica TaxID=390379 RepID=UPI00147202D7|nr:erythrocyte band 7 integral membrane protein-like [Thalassophryne amazonica]